LSSSLHGFAAQAEVEPVTFDLPRYPEAGRHLDRLQDDETARAGPDQRKQYALDLGEYPAGIAIRITVMMQVMAASAPA
jgi:hypothetical protein